MTYDHRQGVMNALQGFYQRTSPVVNKSKAKNKKPEAAVVSAILLLNSRGWFLHRFEAKSAYDPVSGKYRMTHVSPGYPDISGMCCKGFAAFIEVKAPGKRSTVRQNQLDFLTKAIKHGGFGVVADSMEYVESTQLQWIDRARKDRKEASEFLLSLLPVKKKGKQDSLF